MYCLVLSQPEDLVAPHSWLQLMFLGSARWWCGVVLEHLTLTTLLHSAPTLLLALSTNTVYWIPSYQTHARHIYRSDQLIHHGQK